MTGPSVTAGAPGLARLEPLEFLATLSEAPDFATAATFAVTELARSAGVTRCCLLEVQSSTDSLVVAGHSGFDPAPLSFAPIPLGDLSNPLVVATLALQPARRRDATFAHRSPIEDWLALPMPRPYRRGAPALLSPSHAAELLNASGAESLANVPRFGQSSGGVFVLDASNLDDVVVPPLIQLASLSGPVLSRFSELALVHGEAERLRQLSGRLTLMMNALPDPIVITDAANNILVQNARAEHLLAASDADSPGRRRALEMNNLLFTSGLARAVMAAGERSAPRELNLVDPGEGTDLLFELLAHPLSGDERGGAVLSVLRDVTDLRLASEELERQVHQLRQARVQATKERDRLNVILGNVADPILVTDDQAKILLMNEKAEQLFEVGDTGSSAYEYHVKRAVLSNDTRFSTFIAEFSLSGDRARHERMTLVRPENGTELPIEVVSGKIPNERGEAVAIVSVLHDLTKQVENERLYGELKAFSSELEARVRAATRDLEAQNEQLKWQSQEVEKANKLKSDFLANMSHELRTPINAIMGHSALVSDEIYGPLNSRQNDAMRRIGAAAQDLLALINNILDLARIEAGKMPVTYEDVDLRRVIAELDQQIEPLVKKRGLTFSVSMCDGCSVIRTDRQKFKQILLNLLSNAIKFTNQGGITVTVERDEDALRVAVADTGIGIQSGDLDVIWEDFRQVDQSMTREVGGTGLGLSIVRNFMDHLGGHVTVSSTYGVGTIFTLTLPLVFPVHASGLVEHAGHDAS
ncbi:MAG: ATP-binding protein [Gemmatimonadaceae bacterium]